jgi:hypothetical protein
VHWDVHRADLQQLSQGEPRPRQGAESRCLRRDARRSKVRSRHHSERVLNGLAEGVDLRKCRHDNLEGILVRFKYHCIARIHVRQLRWGRAALMPVVTPIRDASRRPPCAWHLVAQTVQNQPVLAGTTRGRRTSEKLYSTGLFVTSRTRRHRRVQIRFPLALPTMALPDAIRLIPMVSMSGETSPKKTYEEKARKHELMNLTRASGPPKEVQRSCLLKE